jgi:AraC-like DNA-binding protein
VVTYFERYASPSTVHEEMWLQFKFNQPWPVLTKRPFIAVADPDQHLCAIARRMNVLFQQRERDTQLLLHAMLLTFLAELSAAAGAGRAGTPDDPWVVRGHEQPANDGSGQLLNRVDQIVTRRLANPPSLDELAEQLALSVSSLAHQFKAETGMTIVERIRWLRIRQARVLLSRDDASAKNVAARLGFSSASYFARVFGNVTGATPEAYMRLLRRGK